MGCVVQLKVLRPGRPSNNDKAAAALLCDISSTSSFLQMPAAVGSSDGITTQRQVSSLTAR